MEFLVDFKVNVPTGASESEVKDREKAEASATAKVADEGHLVRLWRRTVTSGDRPIVGLFRADSETELDSMIGALPLYEWLDVSVTPLKSHANDPAEATVPSRPDRRTGTSLPDPGFAKVYRLEATLGQPLDIGVPGDVALDRTGAPPERLDLRLCAGRPGFIDVGQDDVHAGPRHGQRRTSTDSARSASDDRNCAFEIHIAVPLQSIGQRGHDLVRNQFERLDVGVVVELEHCPPNAFRLQRTQTVDKVVRCACHPANVPDGIWHLRRVNACQVRDQPPHHFGATV